MSSKVIVITGVSKGLGRAMTTYFLSHGHTVIGCARSQDIISDMKVKFASASDRCHLAVVDVSKEDQVEAWAKKSLQIATPDIVINNACFINDFMPFLEVSVEDFDLIIDSGLKGTASVMRHFLPSMIKAGSGAIVNLSSIYASQSQGYAATYTTVKHGVQGFSKAVAQELPESVCIVLLDPGIVGTDIIHEVLPAEVATRLMQAEEWAEHVCPFILTIDHSMNGQSLNIPEILGIKCGHAIQDGRPVYEGIDY